MTASKRGAIINGGVSRVLWRLKRHACVCVLKESSQPFGTLKSDLDLILILILIWSRSYEEHTRLNKSQRIPHSCMYNCMSSISQALPLLDYLRFTSCFKLVPYQLEGLYKYDWSTYQPWMEAAARFKLYRWQRGANWKFDWHAITYTYTASGCILT